MRFSNVVVTNNDNSKSCGDCDWETKPFLSKWAQQVRVSPNEKKLGQEN